MAVSFENSKRRNCPPGSSFLIYRKKPERLLRPAILYRFPESIGLVAEVVALLVLDAIVVIDLAGDSSTAAVIDGVRDVHSDQRGEDEDSSHGSFSFDAGKSGNYALMSEAASDVSTASCWYYYSIRAPISHAFSARSPISGLEIAPCNASGYQMQAAELCDEF